MNSSNDSSCCNHPMWGQSVNVDRFVCTECGIDKPEPHAMVSQDWIVSRGFQLLDGLADKMLDAHDEMALYGLFELRGLFSRLVEISEVE